MKKIALFNVADLYSFSDQFPALGLGYIKSYCLEKIKDEVQVMIFRENIIRAVTNYKPDLIGISSVTQFYSKAVQSAITLKKQFKDVILVIGGVHISTLPESLNDVFDCGVIGEGEETFYELVSLLKDNEFYKDNLKAIDGLAFKYNGELIITRRRELIKELDSLPHLDRNDYKHMNYSHIVSSRGCPYKCKFCSSTYFWGASKVRYHSAQYVFDEIRLLVEHNSAIHITFWDDLFVFSRKRLNELLELLKQAGKKYKHVTYSCTARANIVNDDLCEILRKLNVKYVYLGLESGSDRVLKNIKGGVSVNDNINAVNTLHKWGFFVSGSFVINNPDEEEDDLKATYEFIKAAPLSGGTVNVAIPLPATPYWDYALSKGLVSNDMDFEKLNVKTDFMNLRSGDFIKLSENITSSQIIEWGAKIQKEIGRKALLSTAKLINKNNITVAIKNPRLFLKFLFDIIKDIRKYV
ncbi:MAG: B12-binding domain-containing radical SAM protein [Nitrospirae bacterium]|nr:B12-binding domain-containing radical SAM protein [Nitrospirota bacterium]